MLPGRPTCLVVLWLVQSECQNGDWLQIRSYPFGGAKFGVHHWTVRLKNICETVYRFT